MTRDPNYKTQRPRRRLLTLDILLKERVQVRGCRNGGCNCDSHARALCYDSWQSMTVAIFEKKIDESMCSRLN